MQLVKQAHTVIMPPQTAHLQTIYSLPISHHLLVLRLSPSKQKRTYSGMFCEKKTGRFSYQNRIPYLALTNDGVKN